MHGKLTWIIEKLKFEYVGEFRNGKFEGKGTLISGEGKYVGQFKNGSRSGKGKLYYPNSRYYEGSFQNDLRQGHGSITD